MKPLGVSLNLTASGPVMSVVPSDKTKDAIWEAVERAIEAGMTPAKFMREARSAWEQQLTSELKRQMSEWDRR